MGTTKGSSGSAFTDYMNGKLQDAIKQDFKNNAKALHYPGKDEIGMVDDPKVQLDASNTFAAMPGAIGSYMADTSRAFAIPAPDKKTTAATLKMVDVEKKTKTGTVMLGDKKGDTYTSTVAAHTEMKVVNNRKPFKK